MFNVYAVLCVADTVVKQADVVMLNYPLMEEDRGSQVTINDQTIYETVTTFDFMPIHWIYKLEMEGRKEMIYLTMHSTHFIYGYMVLDIW